MICLLFTSGHILVWSSQSLAGDWANGDGLKISVRYTQKCITLNPPSNKSRTVWIPTNEAQHAVLLEL